MILTGIKRKVTTYILNNKAQGCLGGSLVKHPALDFSSGHDLTVHGIKPRIGLCTDTEEPAWDSLSLPLSLPFPCSCTLPLSINK